MRQAVAVLSILTLFSARGTVRASSDALPAGAGTVTLVDGAETNCEVLFVHPNAPLLIVRSPVNRTVQSLPLSVVHSVMVGEATQTYSPRRALTEAEKTERENSRLWGDEAGAGQLGKYAVEEWERKPVIVWARPGASGDATRSSSWLDERGRPYTSGPWKAAEDARGGRGSSPLAGHFDGDVLLPAAEEPYNAIQAGNRDHLRAFGLRHLTVERNASYNVRFMVTGNLWLKHGSDMGHGTQTGDLGSRDAERHTFLRVSPELRPRRVPNHALKSTVRGKSVAIRNNPETRSELFNLTHWVRIDTGERGSLEVIGRVVGPSDRMTVQRGTLIVSEDSYFGNGPRAAFYSAPGTTVILLDGASVGCTDRVVRDRRGTYGIGGTLMFGAPEKPLKRDLRFEMTLYNLQDADPGANPSTRTTGGSLVLGPTGRMVIHSCDPRRARVIFCPRPEDAPYSSYAVGPRAGGREMPTGIVAVFRGQTDFNGVVFDGFYKGGIIVSEEARAQWKNVSFGPNNHGEPEELFRAP